MRASIKDLFSLSATDSEYFNDEQEKFELVSCPLNGKSCEKLRPAINKDYQESQLYRRNKAYQQSLDTLKNAFNTTFELTKPSCANCADFFRSSIIESMENIKVEQRKQSAGLFRFRFPQVSFLKLDNAVKEV